MSNKESKIHPMAIVAEGAKIGHNVEIGPYSVIGENVEIGEGTKVHANVTIEGWTAIGKDCEIFPSAVIGCVPQDLKFKEEKSYVVIGDRVKVRECVTIHRGTGNEGVTRVGNDVLLMACAHVAHDCQIGNNVILANFVGVAGHVIIEDRAIVGGMTGIHQFCKIGRNAMIGGMSRIVQDVPPFMIVGGNPSVVAGLNSIGLARAGISPASRAEIKKGFKILYHSNLSLDKAIESMEQELDKTQEIEYMLSFLKKVERGICRGAKKGEHHDVVV